jgi:hypothetical protein
VDNLKMQTQSIADEKYAALAALFPNAVTESVNEHGETVRAVDTDVLRREESVDFDTTENLYAVPTAICIWPIFSLAAISRPARG